jgi:AraC-like DNA-binding protein
MAQSAIGEPRGILNPKLGEQKFQLTRLLPAEDLRLFVEHYWIVSWDLRGQEPYLAETLPYPSVHLVIQNDTSKFFGVFTGKFCYLLNGKGRAFGIKFKPGAFYPFVNVPIARFTDRAIDLSDMFGAAGIALEQAILALEDQDAMIEAAEHFLRAQLPQYDQNITLINQVIDLIIVDGTIIKVDDIVTRLHLTKRWLQRIFNQYVGVSPKWVIKRYRLHEAAEKLAHGQAENWAALALQLGYFDQTHFIKDFKAIVGKTPVEYARQIG